jgi:hypothetical protein
VLRTSSWLAPSLTNRSCDLPAKKTRDASNRLLPPNRTACTRTSCVPSSSRHFRSGDAPRRLRLRTAFPGDRTFHDVRERFGGSTVSAEPHARCRMALVMSVGVVFPRRCGGPYLWHPCRDFEVDSSSRLARLRERCNLAGRPALHRVGPGRRMSKPPRPPSTPSRESRRFVMIRGAFDR